MTFFHVHTHRGAHVSAMKLSSDSSPNRCSNCKKSYSQRSTLKRHSETCGKTKLLKPSLKFKCDYCAYKTPLKSNLRLHIQGRHLPRDPSLNKCKRCQFSFSHPSSLLKHSRMCGKTKAFKHSLKRYHCNYCSFKADLKSSLSFHIKVKHLPQDPNNLCKCTKCDKMFTHPKYLTKHSKFCSASTNMKRASLPFSCAHCDFIAYRKPHLSEHIIRVHMPPGLYESDKEKNFSKDYIPHISIKELESLALTKRCSLRLQKSVTLVGISS